MALNRQVKTNKKAELTSSAFPVDAFPKRPYHPAPPDGQRQLANHWRMEKRADFSVWFNFAGCTTRIDVYSALTGFNAARCKAIRNC